MRVVGVVMRVRVGVRVVIWVVVRMWVELRVGVVLVVRLKRLNLLVRANWGKVWKWQGSAVVVGHCVYNR